MYVLYNNQTVLPDLEEISESVGRQSVSQQIQKQVAKSMSKRAVTVPAGGKGGGGAKGGVTRAGHRITFLPFLPRDNTPNESDIEQMCALKHNISQCSTLMRMSTMKFVNQVHNNTQLTHFVLSYLTYRFKPFLRATTEGIQGQGEGEGDAASSVLVEIDRYVSKGGREYRMAVGGVGGGCCMLCTMYCVV
jgi:hypothetical protein